MKILMRSLAAIAILLMSLPAVAGTQGRVTGRVTDSAGSPRTASSTLLRASAIGIRSAIQGDLRSGPRMGDNQSTRRFRMYDR